MFNFLKADKKKYIARAVLGVFLFSGVLADPAMAADYSQLNISFTNSSSKDIGSGAVYKKISGKNSAGSPVVIHVLEVDPKNDGIEIKPAVAASGVSGREKLSSFAKRTGATAAVNGTFFSMSKPYLPIGNLMIDGKLVASSDMWRASFGMFADKSFKAGYYNGQNGADKDPYWQDVQHLWTAGPLLVEDGEPVFEAVQEGYKGSVLSANARTAMGATSKGNLLLVVVDRTSKVSVGVTLEELSMLMIKLGAVNAIALDGGGSSEMLLDGKVVNRPADGTERAVNNAILIFASIPVYIDGEKVTFDKAPIMDNGRVLVPFRALLEKLGATVNYDSKTGLITANKASKKVEFKAGQKVAVVDGQQIQLDVPAKIIGGSTYVPLRFAGTALGANVTWTTDKKVKIELNQQVEKQNTMDNEEVR